MTKTIRVAVLLIALSLLAVFYSYQLGKRSGDAATSTQENLTSPKPALIEEPLSPVHQSLRRDDFAALDVEFARVEKAAETDAAAEGTLFLMVEELGHGTDEDQRQLERWATGDHHYALLVLSRWHRVRGFRARGTDYANKVDPRRMARFAEHNRASIAYAEQALKTHADCGVAYSQMIDALVGNASRKDIDAMYKRAQAAAPRWGSPALSYSFALHPKWHGRTGEREQFSDRFAKRHPGHRAVPWLQAAVYANQSAAAIDDYKYGEGMILADLAIGLNSGNSYAWLNKGRAFSGVQRAPEALQAMDKAIQNYPYSDSAYRVRGKQRLLMAQPAGQEDLVRAALLGDVWALKQAMMNWITGTTPGVAKDWSRIPDLCERVRAAGIPDGVFCVATVHYFGYGLPLDRKKGFAVMREAADLGVVDAMSDVGKIFWQGNAAAGVAPDKEQAVRYWIRAADMGNDRALVELSQVKKDPELLELVNKIRQEQQPPPPQTRQPQKPKPGAA